MENEAACFCLWPCPLTELFCAQIQVVRGSTEPNGALAGQNISGGVITAFVKHLLNTYFYQAQCGGFIFTLLVFLPNPRNHLANSELVPILKVRKLSSSVKKNFANITQLRVT